MAKQVQPDYTALLRTDPALQALIAQVNAAGTQDKSALTAQRQQALIGYGAVPTVQDSALTGNLAPDIDQATRGLAQASTDSGLSTTAQLRQAYEQNRAGSNAALAARGMLQSGAYLQHANADLSGYQGDQATAQASLLAGLAGDWNTYQGQQATNAGNVNQGVSDALSRIVAGIGNGTVNPTAAPVHPLAAALAPTAPQVKRNTTGYTQPGPSLTARPIAPVPSYAARAR